LKAATGKGEEKLDEREGPFTKLHTKDKERRRRIAVLC